MLLGMKKTRDSKQCATIVCAKKWLFSWFLYPLLRKICLYDCTWSCPHLFTSSLTYRLDSKKGIQEPIVCCHQHKRVILVPPFEKDLLMRSHSEFALIHSAAYIECIRLSTFSLMDSFFIANRGTKTSLR